MPELPEVETVVRRLRPLVGRRFASVTASRYTLRHAWSKHWAPLLAGRRIMEVRRRGKWIVIALDGGSSLVFHLGMTGQLMIVPADKPVADHTHLRFGLNGGADELRFRDVRRFGGAKRFADEESLGCFFERVTELGPEPFDLDPAEWRAKLLRTDRTVKAVLLDQRVVAGVGNIYADESLFEARLHPTRKASDLSTTEAERLRRAVAGVLARAIKCGGSTLADGQYVGGGYQAKFRAYGRAGEPCGRCGTAIERVSLAGRSTHYCPSCQQ